ncbi:MAG: hypothetical protein GPOALKHO_000245 [Sodalis sp.]|nr:MAG: hypothetical protein GPOALKHO_000245 [Sodalis sp.]
MSARMWASLDEKLLEMFLDLHGLTQAEVKQELGALLAACRRENVYCACV